jgi:hypothetical protein
MKKIVLLAVVMLMTTCWGFSQHKNYWTKSTAPHSAKQVRTTSVVPSTAEFFNLDLDAFKKHLDGAPVRGVQARTADKVVTFPTPDGNLERFTIIEASVFHPKLAAKYPGIKSYAGQGMDDPTATIRFSISDDHGFYGMILSGEKSSIYIDPYSQDKKTYTVYSRKDLPSRPSDFQCFTEHPERKTVSGNTAGRTDDKKLRKYRLALSCNAEYGNIFAGTTGTDAQKKARILSQMNITMTRVNGVYERDLSITMELVPNNDVIIYFGSTSTDPWSGEFNDKTQQVIDDAIGNANYDIGHNFNTSGGGNAGCIACVCTTGSKGSGYTGSTNPTGDAFDIDYVAHEMGHQFGGYHTQSNSSCRSGSGSTEVEPGSGSSIMGYAGICNANVQNNSDAYFAYVNIRDISQNIQSGASASCAQVINLVNNPPTANAGSDYTIPKSTAFVLKGQGSDPDGDAVTFTWEQNDPQNPNSNAAPTPTRTVGPMFRSLEGTVSPNRYLPKISDVVANNLAPTWEVIPSVARTLNFSLTVRDNKAGGGQTSDDLMRVTVDGTAGPFVVNAPNTAVTWSVGSSQTVTWSVASTNIAPVNCANINILLSTDGGFTYPVTLISNTPNDGSEVITVPNNTSTTCRIKVEAADNIFYDISNVNFSITGGGSCTAITPTGVTLSAITATSATVSWSTVTGATYDVQYRPTGSTLWNTVPASTATVSISGLTSNTAYEVQVRSKCGSTMSAWSASVNFTTLTPACTATVPTGLAASGVTTTSATLTWNTVNGASYDVQYRPTGTSTWTNVGATTTSISISALTANTPYEAQVRSKCTSTTSSWSASVTFTTLNTGLNYCVSKGNNAAEEYISRVQLGTINNASGGNNGYGNFTSLSTDLEKGSTYTLTVTPTWTGSVYSEGYAAWIDFNQDGDFDDSGEQVWTRAASQTTPVSSSIAIPATAVTGPTRIRISMKYNAIPTSCEMFSYGEVEDYTVNIKAGTTTCTNVTLTLKFDNYPEETSWNIKNSAGGIVASGGPYNTSPDGSTITSTTCLPAGCYTYTILDTYGDGICCAFGNGSYSVVNAAGTTLFSGGTFTSSATHSFCVGGVTAKGDQAVVYGEKISHESTIFPNPVSDRLKIRLKDKTTIRSITITAMDGKIMQAVAGDKQELDVEGLPTGLYIITIGTNRGMIIDKIRKK